MDEGLTFFKSSFSQWNPNCVEVAHLPGGGMALRDDKDRSKPAFQFNREEWVAFIAGAKAGDFDPIG